MKPPSARLPPICKVEGTKKGPAPLALSVEFPESVIAPDPKPPRMELSLNHETKRMVQELLDCIREMGKDTACTRNGIDYQTAGTRRRAEAF